jgi:hypothetical protein
MAKRKHKQKSIEAALPISPQPQPLLRKSDVLWLVAIITVLLSTFELWHPETAVTDAQILGLAITLSASAIISRFLLNHRRAKREK